jgi:hypothetical protein
MKSGNLNFLEPSGPLQACNGTALPLPYNSEYFNIQCTIDDGDKSVLCEVGTDSLKYNPGKLQVSKS